LANGLPSKKTPPRRAAQRNSKLFLVFVKVRIAGTGANGKRPPIGDVMTEQRGGG